MSILRIILIILNLLGITAVVVLGLMAYGRRQAWAYANYRHDVMVKGLPLTREETDEQGRPRYLELGDPGGRTLKELFVTTPVLTQREEVNRVHQDLQSKVAAAGDERKESLVYARILQPLARTNAQRERLVAVRFHLADDAAVAKLKQDFQKAYAEAAAAGPAKPFDRAFVEQLAGMHGEPRLPFQEAFLKVVAADNKKPFDAAFTETLAAVHKELKDQFDGEFRDVLAGPRTADAPGGKLNPDEWRDAAARLLFDVADVLAEQPAAAGQEAAKPQELFASPVYRRYVNVVGLEAAVRAMNREAAKLNQIAAALEYEQERERIAFAQNLKPIVERSRDAAQRIESTDKDLKRLQKQFADQQVLVQQRKANVTAAEQEWATLQTQTAAHLAELRRDSRIVYDTRVAARDASVLNQEHERTLRRLEGWRWLPFVGGSFLVVREEAR